MAEVGGQVSIEGRGREIAVIYVGKDGKRTELVMPVAAITALQKNVQEMTHKILLQRAGRPAAQPGITPGMFFPVSRAGLNVEPQTHEILLTLFDTLGNESGFALPLEVARPLAERLPVRLAEAEAAAKAEKKN